MSSPWHPVSLHRAPWDIVTQKHNLRPPESEALLPRNPHFYILEPCRLLVCLLGSSGAQDYSHAGEPPPLGPGLSLAPRIQDVRVRGSGRSEDPLMCSFGQT